MNSDRRRLLEMSARTVSVAALAWALRLQASTPEPAKTMSPAENDGRHDFDFFYGHWRISNRRLQQRHVGSTAWDTFDATIRCRPVLGGIGHIDEFESDFGGGMVGAALRLFDVHKRQWCDYWVSGRDGLLGVPMLGAFTDGVGHFEGRDSDGERAVIARYLWSHIGKDHVTWEQAFSTDEGKSWETNWVMQMTRVEV
jgi:hypothetical protein